MNESADIGIYQTGKTRGAPSLPMGSGWAVMCRGYQFLALIVAHRPGITYGSHYI